MTIRLALLGFGYWGPNLARNLAGLPGAELYALCDISPERLSACARQYPAAKILTDFEKVFADPQVDAVVIATPVPSHFALASAALAAGKHVMVEKPLAQTSEECRRLIELAEAKGRTLMAGHVFLYNPAVRKMKEYIDSGLLGEIYYVYSQRLNLGIIRKDINALWNFAPHDLSIINYWLGASPVSVVARGYSYVQPGIEDVVFMTLDYPKGVGANVHISWLDPHKVRRMTIVGSKKMAVYDDVNAEARVMIYDKGITRRVEGQDPAVGASPLGRAQGYGEFQLLLRAGDVLIPKVDNSEPLRMECQHFVECIQTGKRPLTDGHEGLRVVEALQAAQTSLTKNGLRVAISGSATPSGG